LLPGNSIGEDCGGFVLQRSPEIFGPLMTRQRCIVPLSGFYEWKTEGSRKRPFNIDLKHKSVMSVAGIWDSWRPGTPFERRSFSILTTSANSFMQEIHDRMPVILDDKSLDDWLSLEIHERPARPAKTSANHPEGDVTHKRRQPRPKRYPATCVSFSYPPSVTDPVR
jgi:putative SOS response-associated peptidase YedK